MPNVADSTGASAVKLLVRSFGQATAAPPPGVGAVDTFFRCVKYYTCLGAATGLGGTMTNLMVQQVFGDTGTLQPPHIAAAHPTTVSQQLTGMPSDTLDYESAALLAALRNAYNSSLHAAQGVVIGAAFGTGVGVLVGSYGAVRTWLARSQPTDTGGAPAT